MADFASHLKYAIASILIVIVTIIVDVAYFQEPSQDDHHKKAIEQAKMLAQKRVNEKKAENETHTQNKLPKAAISNTAKLAFVDIPLPSPQAIPLSHENKPAKPSALLGTLGSHGDVEPSYANKVQKTNLRAETSKLVDVKNESPKASTVAQKVSELSDLKGSQRVLYFPNENAALHNKENAGANEKILRYMHKCLDVGLAALDGTNLIMLNKPGHVNSTEYMAQYSQLIRVVSGAKLPLEQDLLSLYAPNKSLVRLFPYWFDQTLGYYLAKQLHNTELTQFSAQYMLQKGSLWLTDISVNNENVTQAWLIKQGC